MADVIICLGRDFLKSENIKQNQSRVEKAVGLYIASKAKKIIFTGGFYSRKDLSEAKFISKIALKLGVPKKDIILEEKSIDTIENAKYCKKLMKEHKFNSAIIVTSDWHTRRTKYIFQKVMKNKELEFVSSNDGIGFLKKIQLYWKEFLALRKLKKTINF